MSFFFPLFKCIVYCLTLNRASLLFFKPSYGFKRQCSNLHKEVEEPQGRDDDGHERSGEEDDGARPQHVKHGAHEHLDDAGDHRVDGVRLLGEAVDQVPAGSALEKRHGRAQDVIQHGLVEEAGRQDPTDGHGDGVREHGNA